MKAGDEAEIAFDGVPGRVFKAKVHEIVEAIAAGQLAPGGTLQDLGTRPEDGGRMIATFKMMTICPPISSRRARPPKPRLHGRTLIAVEHRAG